MIDFKACTLSGVIKLNKCRAIWKDGFLNLWVLREREPFLAAKLKTEQPRRKPRHFNTWLVRDMDGGQIVIKKKCLACGGFWRVAFAELPGAV